jgi:hypothetical protein
MTTQLLKKYIKDILNEESKKENIPSIRLFIEFFVKDFNSSYDFYTNIIRMKSLEHEEDFARLLRGKTQIHLLSIEELPNALKSSANYSLAARTEVCLEVASLEELKKEFEYIKSKKWPFESEIKYREWQKYDFRIKDPEGVYIRFSTPWLGED